jgi:hypothetical protein
MEGENRDLKKEVQEAVDEINERNRQMLDEIALKLEQAKPVEVILDNEGEE